MEENRPLPQPMQSMRPPPGGISGGLSGGITGGISGGIPPPQHHILPMGTDRGSAIKKEAEVDPIAATN